MSRVPQLPPDTPRTRSPWRRAVGTAALWLAGWRVEGNLPNLRKFVLVVAPHTSNWDFVVGFFVYLALQIETRWFAKHTALIGPLGPLGRHFGAVAIDRSRAAHVVQAYIEEFNKRESMILTLAPEGTRSRVPDWKHGFHRVARGAGVPMVPVALDFSRKRIIFGSPQMPTDDYVADMARFKPFFRAEMAKHPENYDEALPTAVGGGAQPAGSSRNESRSST